MSSSGYTFQLCDKFLSAEEKKVFDDFLNSHNLDKNIWDVFTSLFSSKVKGSIPLMLKVYEESNLCGAAIIIRCTRYGRSLFNNKALAKIIDFVGTPFYLWIKFGCCMDMMSNPGFVRDPDKSEEIYSAMGKFL
jgi:hypothetical protein